MITARRNQKEGDRMFRRDEKGAITMHRGDTGAFKVRARKGSGAAWTEDDRMIWTVKNAQGEIVMQRLYRLDTELGDGIAEIQFHNNDTDSWDNGSYITERRYVINAFWDGDAPAGDVVDAMTAGVRIIDGHVVRVPEYGQQTMDINDVYGEV